MLTVAKLCRLWQTGRHRELVRELVAGRAEGRLALDQRLPGRVTAAAFGLIRLRELGQPDTPFARELSETLTWAQARDGSFAEPGDDAAAVAAKTALAIRALADRSPEASARALRWLADHQSPTGWADGSITTAFVLLQTAKLRQSMLDLDAAFATERLDGPVEPDAATRWAWKHARLRAHRPAPRPEPQPAALLFDN
ncbi:MAG: hypothetical protein AAGI46_15790 [Planctomycetota bacterium]